MIEVEIKAKIKDIENTKNALKKSGAKFLKTERQVDSVFGHPTMLDENNFVVEGGYSARVREKDGKTEVTFKEILRGQGGIEVNAPIASLDLGRKFLARLGFQEALTISKLERCTNLKIWKLAGIRLSNWEISSRWKK